MLASPHLAHHPLHALAVNAMAVPPQQFCHPPRTQERPSGEQLVELSHSKRSFSFARRGRRQTPERATPSSAHCRRTDGRSALRSTSARRSGALIFHLPDLLAKKLTLHSQLADLGVQPLDLPISRSRSASASRPEGASPAPEAASSRRRSGSGVRVHLVALRQIGNRRPFPQCLQRDLRLQRRIEPSSRLPRDRLLRLARRSSLCSNQAASPKFGVHLTAQSQNAASGAPINWVSDGSMAFPPGIQAGDLRFVRKSQIKNHKVGGMPEQVLQINWIAVDAATIGEAGRKPHLNTSMGCGISAATGL
jgi:hypothetical protein